MNSAWNHTNKTNIKLLTQLDNDKFRKYSLLIKKIFFIYKQFFRVINCNLFYYILKKVSSKHNYNERQ